MRCIVQQPVQAAASSRTLGTTAVPSSSMLRIRRSCGSVPALYFTLKRTSPRSFTVLAIFVATVGAQEGSHGGPVRSRHTHTPSGLLVSCSRPESVKKATVRPASSRRRSSGRRGDHEAHPFIGARVRVAGHARRPDPGKPDPSGNWNVDMPNDCQRRASAQVSRMERGRLVNSASTSAGRLSAPGCRSSSRTSHTSWAPPA